MSLFAKSFFLLSRIPVGCGGYFVRRIVNINQSSEREINCWARFLVIMKPFLSLISFLTVAVFLLLECQVNIAPVAAFDNDKMV